MKIFDLQKKFLIFGDFFLATPCLGTVFIGTQIRIWLKHGFLGTGQLDFAAFLQFSDQRSHDGSAQTAQQKSGKNPWINEDRNLLAFSI
jgi:hypothetical protein